jgi:Rrf2 family protein
MLKINRQTDYAVRILLALAKRPAGTRLSSTEIREEMLIPAALMARIVARLAKSGLLDTFAGRDGGLSLPRPASQLNRRDVLEAFEGPIRLSDCMQEKYEDECPFQHACPVRSKWTRVQNAALNEMETVTFEELAREAKRASK